MVRKQKRSFQTSTVAFFSSRIEKLMRDCNCRWGKGGIGGLTDVESVIRGQVGMQFQMAANVIRVESGSSCMTLTNQHSWKRIWWGCVIHKLPDFT